MSQSSIRSTYFLDSSAIAKRYANELGTAWISELCVPNAERLIALSQISLVEVAAVLAAKQRGNHISSETYDQAFNDLLADAKGQYFLVDVDPAVIDRAVQLTCRQKLRGCDAIQLAGALALHDALLKNDLPGITFVCADDDLLSAASAEGLAIENPNLHA
ncbi:MAG: type II toxin-antitoxin system VapC family toxin [Chloroflexi bacterium]|nr:type II toxin-antitoxin system VapC family toxin [Chloroflexota bacterium]